MQPAQPLSSAYTPEQLATACADRQADASHEPFCVELFRRALHGLQHESGVCWAHISTTYSSLVAGWVRLKARGLAPHEQTALTADVFARFWKYFTPSHLQVARGLGPILGFLRSCAVSVALDWVRSAQRQREDSLNALDGSDAAPALTVESAENTAQRQIMLDAIWQAIAAEVRNERERVVAQLTFSEGLKPAQIYAAHTELFRHAADVHEAKRVLLERLRHNPTLREYYHK